MAWQSLGKDPRTITPGEFMDRFTPEEWAMARANDNVNLQFFMARFDASQDIGLDNPNTIAALNLAVLLGVLTPERVAEIRS